MYFIVQKDIDGVAEKIHKNQTDKYIIDKRESDKSVEELVPLHP